MNIPNDACSAQAPQPDQSNVFHRLLATSRYRMGVVLVAVSIGLLIMAQVAPLTLAAVHPILTPCPGLVSPC